jgi:Uma2 family endonuclease
MSSIKPRALQQIEWEKAAEEYLRGLPPEHFMEATPQATQRKITLESFDLVHAKRPEVQVFNELLVQYTYGRKPQRRQVVPDNMIVLHEQPIRAVSSFNLPFQPAGPFCMLEYVSKDSMRKDYEDNMRRYERELKVPYYLLFYPDAEELTLYRLTGRKYVSVKPNQQHRVEIPELEIEVGLLDGWMRFWFRGELLPLPADLQRELEAMRQKMLEERQARLAAEQKLIEEQQARLTAEQREAEERQARLAAEQRQAEEQQARLTAEQRQLALEDELARLRARLAQQQPETEG